MPVHLDDLALAVTESQTGALSVYDRICLYTAKRLGFGCITNDKRLRFECQQNNIPVLWGLETIYLLYQNNGITHKEAKYIGETIYKNSHGRITKETFHSFIAKIMK